MLPTSGNLLQSNITVAENHTQTFRMDTERLRIGGVTDGLAAVRQAVMVMLSVERYSCLIHSWNFGVELADLVGTSTAFALPELERRIGEALMQDDRITGVGDFHFTMNKGAVFAQFTVSTIYGNLTAEKTVNI